MYLQGEVHQTDHTHDCRLVKEENSPRFKAVAKVQCRQKAQTKDDEMAACRPSYVERGPRFL